uniref:Uncharacterized protein n=1 Tax=Romanomermis culicivorax TaxID=13658 RepID=A0A915IDA5_ROMCU
MHKDENREKRDDTLSDVGFIVSKYMVALWATTAFGSCRAAIKKENALAKAPCRTLFPRTGTGSIKRPRQKCVSPLSAFGWDLFQDESFYMTSTERIFQSSAVKSSFTTFQKTSAPLGKVKQ